jgi:enoyl-CoA hydratase/carnithine racemase
MSDELACDRHGPVLVVRLNRPEARNALTSGLLAEVGRAMLEAEADPDIRAAVLTATGERAFCAGMDLESFAAGAPAIDAGEATAGFHRLIRGALRVPLVGAANGTASPAGWSSSSAATSSWPRPRPGSAARRGSEASSRMVRERRSRPGSPWPWHWR